MPISSAAGVASWATTTGCARIPSSATVTTDWSTWNRRMLVLLLGLQPPPWRPQTSIISGKERPWASAQGCRCSGSAPRVHRCIVRCRIDHVLALVVLQLLPGLGEVLARHLEERTRATCALDARVFLDVLPCPGEAVARVEEQLTSLPHTLHRCGEPVRGLGHDVVGLASLRQRVHAAWHAHPVPRPPVLQPLLTWGVWPWASARGRLLRPEEVEHHGNDDDCSDEVDEVSL